MPRSPVVVLLVAVAMLASGACGDDGAGDDLDAGIGAGSATTARSTTTTATASSADPADASADFGTSVVSTPARSRGLLADVEATTVGELDRVTFEFEGDLPGYRVGYVDRPIVEDGSGAELRVDGEAVLQVHFEPASGFDLESGEGRQVYDGPTRLDLATSVVLDVVRQSDFEANLDWVIGLDARSPFRVRTESAPNRVIVEVRIRP